MRLIKIEITNIRGIEHLVIEPGTFTVISGPNGVGKSSIIAALQAIVSGGHDPSLIRLGAESGSITATLDDEATITLTVKPTKSERVVRDAKGRRVSAPQSLIDELVDMVSYNPLGKFLDGTDKERVELLLESLPVTVGADDLKCAKVKLPKGETLNGHGLVVLERLRKFYYDTRRDHNRDLKSKQATISELRAGLPESDDQIATEYDAAQKELGALESETREKVDAIYQTEREEKQRFNSVFTEAEAKIKNGLNAEIERLRVVATEAIDEARLIRDREVSAANVRATTKRSKIESESSEAIAGKREQIGTLKAKADEAQRVAGQRQTIARMQTEADSIATLAQDADNSLTALQALKERLTKDIPIPGLEIVDGRILINDIPLNTLNTAEQIASVAVEVALLRAKDLRCIVIDGGERLDSEHLEALKAIAKRKGCQIIASRVTDDKALNITTE